MKKQIFTYKGKVKNLVETLQNEINKEEKA